MIRTFIPLPFREKSSGTNGTYLNPKCAQTGFLLRLGGEGQDEGEAAIPLESGTNPPHPDPLSGGERE
jgi:hypothetical protein